ncbi:hypothetical protein Leryth_022902 [Lithospermum erythrorhizon]|nr:hypothetical protein Leryth_022902 [Lithospermum erythrorhizon]
MGEMDPLPDRYIKGAALGTGTYGRVFKAVDTKTGQTVAIKKIHIGKQKDGVNFTALREIKMLKELKHPNIIELIDAFPHKGNLHLVFEFMETDLEAVIRDRNIVLSPADIKSYVQMTLKGLSFCHKKWKMNMTLFSLSFTGVQAYVSRLIKGYETKQSSDWISWAAQASRLWFSSIIWESRSTVFALWYRAPELLFGAKQYGPGVDVWAAACIFAELLLRRPFLPGHSEMDQLGKIFAALGTPKPAQWSDMVYLPDYVEYQYVPGQPLQSLFPMASADALDLLSKMFVYDPKARLSAQQALEHRYFSSGPPPTEPALLPRPPPKKDPENSNVSTLNLDAGPTVLSPPRSTF